MRRTPIVTSTRNLATARLEFRKDRRFTQAVQLAAVAALLILALLITGAYLAREGYRRSHVRPLVES